MIRSGEIEGELADKVEETEDKENFDLGFSERVRGSFQLGTEHIRKQHDNGITEQERSRLTIKLLLVLLFLGFVLWYFVFR